MTHSDHLRPGDAVRVTMANGLVCDSVVDHILRDTDGVHVYAEVLQHGEARWVDLSDSKVVTDVCRSAYATKPPSRNP